MEMEWPAAAWQFRGRLCVADHLASPLHGGPLASPTNTRIMPTQCPSHHFSDPRRSVEVPQSSRFRVAPSTRRRTAKVPAHQSAPDISVKRRLAVPSAAHHRHWPVPVRNIAGGNGRPATSIDRESGWRAAAVDLVHAPNRLRVARRQKAHISCGAITNHLGWLRGFTVEACSLKRMLCGAAAMPRLLCAFACAYAASDIDSDHDQFPASDQIGVMTND